MSKATMIEKHYPDLSRKNNSSPKKEDPKDKQNSISSSNKNHINREFFEGHKSQVVFVCHIENGKDMVTIDDNCHIFIWNYTKNHINPRGAIEPAYKYRISLNYQKFEKIASKVIESKKKTEDQKAIYK